MKKLFLVLSVCLMFLNAFAVTRQWTGVQSREPRNAESLLISSDHSETILKFSVYGFYSQEVTTALGSQTIIRVPGGTAMLEKGAPDLPKLTASVIVPDLSAMKVEVISSAYTDYSGYSIAPSKGNLYRNADPSAIPFSFGDAYQRDEFFPSLTCGLDEPYILRDFRGQAVHVFPFRYNPVTGVLRVYTEITVKISEDHSVIARNGLVRKAPVKITREFTQVYNSHFKNPPSVQYTALPEEGRMLIISDAAFMSAMEPFITWKKKRGLEVEMVDMATVGSTELDIKNYVSNYYSTTGLTFLLLVGDYQQIPSPLYSYAQTGGAADPSYGYITGADSYAEVIVGRFSAQSAGDVETQVQRVLSYEMNPIVGAPFYGKGVCVASDQGPGDDNEYDWEHERNIRDDLLAFTYTDVYELYDGSHGGMDSTGDPIALDLFNIFQNGISIVNYTGHGSTNACSTTGFSSNDVASLTNYNMLPFIWSVACVNGDFTNGSCLAEALMTANSGGQPTGAIATLMSSINQSWDPPMDGQDEMVDLLVGTSLNNTMRTFGGLSVNGCMHMNDEYSQAGAEMTDTWHCFGDPSLLVRTAPPALMTVSHVTITNVGSTQLNVLCNTDSAFVSLTLNGEIIGTGLVINGSALISFAALPAIDTLDVTVTAFNKVPYMGIVSITGSTGLAGHSSPEGSVSLFPNPVSGNASIALQLNSPSEVSIVVFDSHGSKVKDLESSYLNKGVHTIRWNAGEFSEGMYCLRVMLEGSILTRTFIINQ